MKCLIVAAGQGTRLREKGELKPLIPIKGVPLIERVIGNAQAAGVDEFFVVTGYRAETLQEKLGEIAKRIDVRITRIFNRAWDRANGVSVLTAKQFIDEPFLLTMCDHLVDPEIFRALIAAPFEPGTVTLAVDFNIDSPLNDPEDVTRVKCQGDKLMHIGKVIRDFNCFDTGVFLCTPVMFDALVESQSRGDDSISGAMNVLAEWGKARVFDIKNRLWVDVDDPAAFAKAEQLLEAGQL
ncbi:phosphocholine cytidylyltransferase family protein [Acidocella aromatica]|uniref:1L-myo-inositol 1-phosphate cytidylyltransferase n=1 Tax=Acidocella aromatica TaxID=1303579 RepID=A0A840VEV9_9PROT|nr:NTP transferase domain-containing protein [Acidocella aromatica]MBB5374226.1 1L-myo-inositol 1-phosphate cytidylyltransferase [Acidocella aromatica]